MLKKGNEHRELFINDRFENNERFEQPIKNIKILNFAICVLKKRSVAGKFIEVRMQCDLSVQFLRISLVNIIR